MAKGHSLKRAKPLEITSLACVRDIKKDGAAHQGDLRSKNSGAYQ
jgi:hypothetical protein